MPGTLTTLALFGWGSLGGIVTAVAVFVLPILSGFALSGTYEGQRARAVATALAIPILGVMAGIIALTLPDDASRGQAIVTGIESLAVIKGIVSTGHEMTQGTR